jgi:hypothetical protein
MTMSQGTFAARLEQTKGRSSGFDYLRIGPSVSVKSWQQSSFVTGLTRKRISGAARFGRFLFHSAELFRFERLLTGMATILKEI